MSKKKAFSGSTMTLKDFHGGSIPSDLPLPSAPGVTARPPDRSGYDRPATSPWGPAGRPDLHRPRPGSAGAGGSRGLDERVPSFLSHAAHIGRHFDEDERKPFDSAASAPRRPDPVRSPPASAAAAKRPVAHHPPAAAVPAFNPPSGNAGSAPNAWAARKEAGGDHPQPANSTATMWSGAAAASRFAQASAIEKVTSGRWHSKPPPPDVEVIRFQEMESLDQRLSESIRIVNDGDHDYQRERARSLAYPETKERNSAVFYQERVRSPVYPEAKERNSAGFYLDGARDHERARSPMYPEAKERNAAGLYRDGNRPTSNDNRSGGPQSPQQGMLEALERPKLKLLPRTKPVESSETLVLDEKQGYEVLVHSVHVDEGHETHDSMDMPKPASAGTDVGSRAVDRPRLNLKPRSQPAEQSDGIPERERKSVFGGARPRELVLKDRGIDNIDANNFDSPLSANRVKNDSPKSDLKLEPATEQRNGRDLERKDYRPDADKGDVQRTTWRNDNRRNSRESEKPLEPRRQEPDTWRKPIEQPKPDSPGPRPGKAASALELAQAFSRSVSDDKSDNRFTSQRGLPGRTQVPFSRLTDTREFHSGPTQRQINGMDVRPLNPPTLIHILEGVTEQAIDSRLQISHQPGDQNNPINLEQTRAPQGIKTHQGGGRNNPINVEQTRAPQGSKTHQGGGRNHPIPVEEITEQQGADPNQPISVEQYEDNVLLQLAIADSLCCQGPPDIIELDNFEGFTVDRKGKKPVRSSKRSFSGGKPTEEVGESSRAPPSEPEAYCSICMEAKFFFECFFMKGCVHMYCASCVSQYVVAKMQDNVTSIGCPDPGCKDGFLDPEMCRMILPPEVFDRWGSALCEEGIVGSMKFYCPYKNCSALLIDEGGDNGEVITDSVCPHCKQLFCAQCKVPWHLGFKCEEYKKLGADEREREDLMLMQVAKKCSWQRCPKCKYFVEKVDGCMFMKCRCGFQFCYGCATQMTRDHYCDKCKR